ncbi:MAG: tyrosine-protein phosphatase [Desulfobulbaceae bacterium]
MARTQGFIDIHSHILPGLDDGPAAMEQCIEAARRYRAAGFSCVVATPHWVRYTGWTFSPELIIRSAAEVEQALHGAGVDLKILPGMEIALTDGLERNILETKLLRLGTSSYYLVEFPLQGPHANLKKALFHLADAQGALPVVLAHPERCAAFQDDDDLLRKVIDRGGLLQMNIDSILGNFGVQIQQIAATMLREGLVHFLATDSHAAGRRMPPDATEWERLTELLGNSVVRAACQVNPGRLLARQAVTPLAVDGERLDKYFSGHSAEKECNLNELKKEGFAGRLRKLFWR